MNLFRRSAVLLLSQLLLLSQIHFSVYAIHCLCTDQIHFSLTAEKDCSSEECKLDTGSCCDSGEMCSSSDHDKTKEEDSACHSPKAALEIGLELEAMVSTTSEVQSEVRFSEVPLYLFFSQLKIPHSSELSVDYEPALNVERPPGFRYLVFGEVLC